MKPRPGKGLPARLPEAKAVFVSQAGTWQGSRIGEKKKKKKMVWLPYTATRRQRAATACLFLTGAALIVAAARLSYANIEPQRAKAAERRRVLEAFIRRKLGSESDHQQRQDPPPTKPP